MNNKPLQLSEEALRLALAVVALVLAAWMSSSKPMPKASALHASLPKPGLVMEW